VALPRRLLLPLVAAALFGFYLFGRSFLWPAPDRSQIRVVGMIEAPEVNVTSRIAGRIEQLDVLEGDAVARGQVVCRIDATDLRNQLAQARAQLARARADLAQAELDFARTRKLFAGNVASAEARDDAATKVQVEEAAVQAAQAAVDLYQDQQRDTEIGSPIDGVVVNKVLEVGEWVTPGTPILTVDDLSTLWARVDVQETELPWLNVGGPAEVTLPGTPPRVLPGRIMAIGQEGQFATERDVRRGRQDIRTFYVKVRLGEGAEAAKPGMTVEVSFARQERALARDDRR
jgi:RND family efflux transporter MFP subunit